MLALPKCPVCLAGYLSFLSFLGLGVGGTVAAFLRPTALTFAAVGALTTVGVAMRRVAIRRAR